MIIQTWIFTDDGQEIFSYKAHNSISTEQERTVNNSIKSLINITKKFIPDDSNFIKSFTVSGLNIHLYSYNEYIVVLGLYLNEKGFFFKKFIRQLTEMVDIYTIDRTKIDRTKNDQYSLNVNEHFKESFLKLLKETEENIYNKIRIKREAKQNYIMKNKEKRVDKKGKYLILGLGSAGKSSIIAQTFEKWTTKQLEGIRPTVGKSLHNYSDIIINESLTIYDLGGQALYRKQHLENKDMYIDVKAFIYVIDLQKPNLETNIEYFKNSIRNIIFNNEKPIVSLFFHKYDPDPEKQLKIFSNLESTLNAFLELISEHPYNDFDISYYITSVYDTSAKDAMVRTLFYTLPVSFLTKTIQNNLVLKAANSLYPILQNLKDISKENKHLIESELYNNSVPFGYEIGRITMNQWLDYLISDEDSSFTLDKDSFVDIEILDESKDVIICLQCPLPKELKDNASICEITHGLFRGLGNYLGYSNSKLLETEIRDSSEVCKIKLS